MSRLLSIGRRFSRDCYLCFGGALVLIAMGAFVGNFRTLVDRSVLSRSEATELYVLVTFSAVSGVICLFAAYGIFKSQRWGVIFAAVVSLLGLVIISFLWMTEPYDRAHWAITLSFWAVPLALTLAWALMDLAQRSKVKDDSAEREAHVA